MSVTEEQDVLRVALTGRIDSGNAAEVEAEIGVLLARTPRQGLVLDLKELEYMSSAGLRVLLRLRKLEPGLRLVNASAEVYEILNLTGFTEMIPVEKAYRTVSIQGCEIIGRGSIGTVYRIDEDTAVKVYHGDHCLADVQRERELARKAFTMWCGWGRATARCSSCSTPTPSPSSLPPILRAWTSMWSGMWN